MIAYGAGDYISCAHWWFAILQIYRSIVMTLTNTTSLTCLSSLACRMAHPRGLIVIINESPQSDGLRLIDQSGLTDTDSQVKVTNTHTHRMRNLTGDFF